MVALPISASIAGNWFALVLGVFGVLFTTSLFILLNKTHKNKNYIETNVADLLSQVKVSNITSIPCSLEGKRIRNNCKH